MLETSINIIEWPSLQYCTISAFGGDALKRKAMSHKSSFIIIDDDRHLILITIRQFRFNHIFIVSNVNPSHSGFLKIIMFKVI